MDRDFMEGIHREIERQEEVYQHFLEQVARKIPEWEKLSSDLQPAFEGQTARGIGIVGAALIEAELKRFIIAHLVNSGKESRDPSRKMSSLFERGQAMESFGAQISLAYLVGLVGEDVYHDLDSIREIRNDFAHAIWYVEKTRKGKRQTKEIVTFDQKDIRALTLSLRCYKVSGFDKWQEKQKKDPSKPILSTNPSLRYALTCQTLHLMLLNGQDVGPLGPTLPLQYTKLLLPPTAADGNSL